LRKLLWNPGEEIALEPLNRTEALALFETACRLFRLDTLDVDEFRSKLYPDGVEGAELRLAGLDAEGRQHRLK